MASIFAAPTARRAATAGAATAEGEAATLCEFQGMLQNTPAFGDLFTGLPSLGHQKGFGFAAEEKRAEAAAAAAPRRAASPATLPPSQGVLGGSGGNLGAAAARVWELLGLPIPNELQGASSSGAASSSSSSSSSCLVAFAWQPHGLLRPLPDGAAVHGLRAPTAVRHCFCACALADDSIALYDLYEHRWPAIKLASKAQQKRVASLAWQPQASSTLAVGCAQGVNLWRLAYAGDGSLAGGHILRTIPLFGGPDAFPLAPTILRWHPLGMWLACASPHHAAVQVSDPTMYQSAVRLPMYKANGLRGTLAALASAAAGSSLHPHGISLVEVSPCASAVAVAGSTGGLRVYETRQWSWQSWPKLGKGRAVVAASWSANAILTPDQQRTLVVSLKGEACLHVIRLGKRGGPASLSHSHGGGTGLGGLLGGGGGVSADYIGHIDLSHLAPSRGLAAASGEALPPAEHTAAATLGVGGGAAGGAAGAAGGASGQSEITCVAWDPAGSRLIVGWGGSSGGGGAASSAVGGVTVLATRVHPTLQLHTIGNLKLPPGVSSTTLRGLSFAAAVGATGGAAGGVVLSAGWDDGRVTLLPLLSS